MLEKANMHADVESQHIMYPPPVFIGYTVLTSLAASIFDVSGLEMSPACSR